MPTPAVEIHKPEAFTDAAADRIAAELQASLSTREKTSFVLTGGRTPVSIYEKLASPVYRPHIDWSRIEFFWGDERCVPPQSPESNFGMAWSTLLSKIQISPDQVHRMPGEIEDAEAAATRYEQEIHSILPGEVPRLDVVLLGMGEDGHTASLFPGTRWNEERLVIANYVPKLKMNRISMTPKLLNQAQCILFLVAGSGKANALANVLQPGSDLPAARIRPVHGRLTWIADSPAAALL